jgi:hypothetical protein
MKRLIAPPCALQAAGGQGAGRITIMCPAALASTRTAGTIGS